MNDCKLYLGDCLDVMKGMPDKSVDAIITDPPYMFTTASSGFGKLSPWADICNAAYWYSAWIKESRRVLKESGCLWQFFSWKTQVTLQKAVFDIGWNIESVLVWDKCWIGPGGPRGLRPSYELVGLMCNKDFKIEDRGIYDIQKFPWSGHKPSGHSAEKPIDLMKWLIEISTKPGDVIADWFMGSGTTGEAAISLGREFIGCELNAEWCEKSKLRIEASQKGVSIKEHNAGQESMF